MYRSTAWALGLSTALAACSPTSEVASGEASGAVSAQAKLDLQRLLETTLKRNAGHGGGVFRVATADEVIFEGAAGSTALIGSPPMTTRAHFAIFSVTKTFTAAAILLAVEDGAATLETPLSSVLPGDAQGLLVIGGKDYGPEITLRRLLDHTSGMPDVWTDGPFDADHENVFLAQFNADPDRRWTGREVLGYARELTPIDLPGRRWHYSNTNYVILGLVLEKLEHQELHDIFRRRFFRPLGMTGTYLSHHEAPPPGALVSHCFEGTEDLNGELRQSADWASGGIVSTTVDLEKFMFALESGRLFQRPSTLRDMRAFIPTGRDGVRDGLGVFQVALDRHLGEMWGHDGVGNAFMYFWEGRGIVFTGTLNQMVSQIDPDPDQPTRWFAMVQSAAERLAPR